MWIVSQLGVFNVVEVNSKNNFSNASFYILAPKKEYLEKLIEAVPLLKYPIETVENSKKFTFQIQTTKDIWVTAIMALTQYIDYRSFDDVISADMKSFLKNYFAN